MPFEDTNPPGKHVLPEAMSKVRLNLLDSRDLVKMSFLVGALAIKKM